jgi:hypothetical protein
MSEKTATATATTTTQIVTDLGAFTRVSDYLAALSAKQPLHKGMSRDARTGAITLPASNWRCVSDTLPRIGKHDLGRLSAIPGSLEWDEIAEGWRMTFAPEHPPAGLRKITLLMSSVMPDKSFAGPSMSQRLSAAQKRYRNDLRDLEAMTAERVAGKRGRKKAPAFTVLNDREQDKDVLLIFRGTSVSPEVRVVANPAGFKFRDYYVAEFHPDRGGQPTKTKITEVAALYGATIL